MAQTYSRLNNPNARVSYMDEPALPASTPNEAQALQNLIAYIATTNTPDLLLLLRSKGISPQGYDIRSFQSATMQMLAMGSDSESEKALNELIKIHPDNEVILQVYGKHPTDCNCQTCGGKKKEAFFSKDKIFWIAFLVILLAGIYFIEKD